MRVVPLLDALARLAALKVELRSLVHPRLRYGHVVLESVTYQYQDRGFEHRFQGLSAHGGIVDVGAGERTGWFEPWKVASFLGRTGYRQLGRPTTTRSPIR